MHKYRSHNCNDLNKQNISDKVKLAGWVHTIRDHGNLLFIDLRDFYGITQLVFSKEDANLLQQAETLRNESVISVSGVVVERSEDTINSSIATGNIEVKVEKINIKSLANILPMQVNSDKMQPEDIRLKYRFLDLRRAQMRDNIILRSKVIAKIRQIMQEMNFHEFQTPILTASSPEGARDFLVPSRMHKGKFYALPQAPQQFKQLLMIAGFDKYFQIAPCFRDEDARADRSPGEFYQLDIEMSFVTQEDVFKITEKVISQVFNEFSDAKIEPIFKQIPWQDSMLIYGTDKPDLRNPLKISDATEIFRDSDFSIFAKNIKKNSVVRAIPAPKTGLMPRSFFDKMIEFAISEGASGLAYIIFDENGNAKGPIAKFLSDDRIENLKKQNSLSAGDSVFFSCAKILEASEIAGKVRSKLGNDLELIDSKKFEFCWITDFPFYELDAKTGKIEFSHNPFSMPQGGKKAIDDAQNDQKKLLELKAWQYDLVCNGVELSSGAVRNHDIELMYKAFSIAGYDKETVNKEFGAMIEGFKYGAPPHGGIAPGIDRIIMLLTGSENIREIIAFPLNQQAQDLMMNAPSEVAKEQLRELGIKIDVIKKIEKNQSKDIKTKDL